MLPSRAHAHVDGDPRIELAGELPLRSGSFKWNELRTRRCDGKCQQLILRREVPLGDIPDPAILIFVGMLPPRISVGEYRSNAGFLQRADDCVAMLRSGLNVRPVEDRRDTRVNRAVQAHEVADVGIFRTIDRCNFVQDESKIARIAFERNVCSDVSQDSFPHVAMRINEAGHDDRFRSVNQFRPVGFEVRCHGCNPGALDQDIGAHKIADSLIETQNDSVFQ